MNVIASFLSTLLVALPALPDPLTTPLTFPQMSSTTLPAVEGTAEVPASDVATSDTKLAATRHIHDNLYEIDIYSASMDRVITNNLLLPPGGPDNTTPRPTFYLMQGSYGGERGDTWATATEYESLFRGKNVNVVSPIGGDGTLFYDWKSTTTPVGTAKWMTYYTQELPFIMETQFHATDKRAIAGLSASGAPALNIAEAYPDKYVAVASLSGYTAVSSTMGRIMSLGVTAAKMAPVWGMFGWPDDPEWLHYDPILHVDKLKNTKVYFYSGSGLEKDGFGTVQRGMFWNGVMEYLVRLTNNPFVAQARGAGVDVTYDREAYGIHDWPYYEDALGKSWTKVIGPALGA